MLAYSPVWMAVVGAVIYSGALARWGEAEYLLFGVALALPLWLMPLVLPSVAERGRPLTERPSVQFDVLIGICVLLQTWLGSQLFFDRLGMEYRFNAHLAFARTPLFLYFMTVAYFSTYYTAMLAALRFFARRFPSAPWPLRQLGRALLCYAVAFAETASMATERMRDFFLYRDFHFTLYVGSLCYGTVFFCTLPLFERLDEPRAPRLGRLALEAVGRNALALALYALYGLFITPR